MSERTCVRGCIQIGVHYATCEHSGPTYTGPFPCRGCAPRPCRDGSLICDVCFGRMRGLLADTRDLLGRLQAIADPTKATPLDQVRVASTATEPAGPVSADLLDAIGTVEQAADWAYVNLPDYTNDLDTVTYLCALILNRHPERDGVRHAWSVQDAVDRWGVERRDRTAFVYPEGEDGDDVELGPVREWYDPLITVAQAAAQAGVSQRSVNRWISEGKLAAARVRNGDGSVFVYVHMKAVDAASKKDRRRGARLDTSVRGIG